MTTRCPEVVVGLLLMASSAASPAFDVSSATVLAGERRAFLACPVVQDTDSVPCWLSSDEHERYYLGIQVDISAPFHPPQLLHKVLVEGTVSDEPRICGGVVLKPVTISVMPEIDLACNTLVKPRNYTILDPPRGPGPSDHGKRIATDASFVATATLPPQTDSPPTQKDFTIPFSFDGLYIDIHAFLHVLEAAHYAQAIHASHIELIGYRGAVRLSNTKILTEKANIAQLRAMKVDEALRELVSGSAPVVHWNSEAEDPARSPDSRRVDISVSP